MALPFRETAAPGSARRWVLRLPVRFDLGSHACRCGLLHSAMIPGAYGRRGGRVLVSPGG